MLYDHLVSETMKTADFNLHLSHQIYITFGYFKINAT
jgi:hypothetical protein